MSELVTISRIRSWSGIDLQDKYWMAKYIISEDADSDLGTNGSYVFNPGVH